MHHAHDIITSANPLLNNLCSVMYIWQVLQDVWKCVCHIHISQNQAHGLDCYSNIDHSSETMSILSNLVMLEPP